MSIGGESNFEKMPKNGKESTDLALNKLAAEVAGALNDAKSMTHNRIPVNELIRVVLENNDVDREHADALVGPIRAKLEEMEDPIVKAELMRDSTDKAPE